MDDLWLEHLPGTGADVDGGLPLAGMSRSAGFVGVDGTFVLVY